ncbi:uncharacterized protein LOC141599194 [Silene latifolia]|uniref:uncharacterized protein LOC141599194 n=1 Tax=Silene latifolia TaxID=37657 RepID=UPI003D78867A
MSFHSRDVEKLGLCRAKIHSLEDELGKLKAEHLFCDIERRRLERELEAKNSELENLSRKLGFSKDTEEKAIARYDLALEYNRELEAEVGKLMAKQLAWDFERRKMERKLEVKNDELEDLTRKLGFSKDAEADAVKRYEQALEYNREVEAKMKEMKTGFDKENGELLGKLSDLKDELIQREVELEPDSDAESYVNDVKCSSKSRKCIEFAKWTMLFEGSLVVQNKAACDQKREAPAYHSDDTRDSSSKVKNHEQDAEQTTIQISMRGFFGRRATMNMIVEPSLTIKGLKSKIQDRFGHKVEQQRLIYEGKQLEDNRTLAHYDIQNDSIIWIVTRCGDSAL